jgi:hypothetical protein
VAEEEMEMDNEEEEAGNEVRRTIYFRITKIKFTVEQLFLKGVTFPMGKGRIRILPTLSSKKLHNHRQGKIKDQLDEPNRSKPLLPPLTLVETNTCQI